MKTVLPAYGCCSNCGEAGVVVHSPRAECARCMDRKTMRRDILFIAMLVVGIVAACIWLTSDSPRYTVTDTQGRVYKHMRHEGSGLYGSKYVGPDGKTLVIKGEHTAVEE